MRKKNPSCNKPKKPRHIFASFFAAAMVALAFAYFNFKYSEFKFLDFSKLHFFTHRNLFVPKSDKYVLLVYSSRATKSVHKVVKNSKYPVLILDVDQSNVDFNNSYNLKSPINTIIQVIQRFNIYTLPSAVIIKKYNKKLYKQSSKLKILNI